MVASRSVVVLDQLHERAGAEGKTLLEFFVLGEVLIRQMVGKTWLLQDDWDFGEALILVQSFAFEDWVVLLINLLILIDISRSKQL